eukprot:CAMPEP_0174252242 /NCGR_PEP_ID=MMETSP0439-20130205/1797_1 /TAXON_ID=0 /ORGANISM="Stereomyxa ramosa, Strain Chinc5" /LENGTH=367 /DNA_ID=CAMNT_0015332753 /DNA_START=49 /DNA_END=1152 /DNA_ORIENTATION=-
MSLSASYGHVPTTTTDPTQPKQQERSKRVEGYLLKRGAKGFSKSFKKRWFSLQGQRLYYYMAKGDVNSLGYIDILAASSIIAAGAKRPCEFLIVTPVRVYTLQAATETGMNQWVEALNAYRRRLLRRSRTDERQRRASIGGGLIHETREQYGIPEPTQPQPVFNTIGVGRRDEKPPVQGLFSTPQESAAGTLVQQELILENQKLQRMLVIKEAEIADQHEKTQKLQAQFREGLQTLEMKQETSKRDVAKLISQLEKSKQTLETVKNIKVGGHEQLFDHLKNLVDDKDKYIEEQHKHIEMLKTKLQERVEEEANKMKEQVKEVIERLRREHEEQLKRARGENSQKLINDLKLENDRLKAQLASLKSSS